MNKCKYVGIIFYFLAILTIFLGTFEILYSVEEISAIIIIFIFAIGCFFIYLGGYFLYKYCNYKKILKINVYIYFCIYLFLLLYFLFFNSFWGRSSNSFKINLIPFTTIKSYLANFNSIVESRVILNLIGNFICLMPFSFFVKHLFPKQNKIYIFLSTLFLCIFSIEVMQYITQRGSFDVDDIILNSSGAILFYLLLKIENVNLLIENFLYLKKHKISKFHQWTIFIVISLILLLLIIVFCFRKLLYNNGMDEWKKIHSPIITLKYENECSNNNLFYEDEIYRYYFECYDSDKFYCIVNGDSNEKFLVNELLNSEKYEIDIERLVGIMENKNIDYRIEPKYQQFDLIENVTGDLAFSKYINGNHIKIVIIRKENNVFEINMIPLSKGKENLNIMFEYYDDEGNLINNSLRKFNFTIDDNFNINYYEIK